MISKFKLRTPISRNILILPISSVHKNGKSALHSFHHPFLERRSSVVVQPHVFLAGVQHEAGGEVSDDEDVVRHGCSCFHVNTALSQNQTTATIPIR